MQDGSSTNTRPANKWSKEKGLVMINVHTWTNILTLKDMLKDELHFESKRKNYAQTRRKKYLHPTTIRCICFSLNALKYHTRFCGHDTASFRTVMSAIYIRNEPQELWNEKKKKSAFCKKKWVGGSHSMQHTYTERKRVRRGHTGSLDAQCNILKQSETWLQNHLSLTSNLRETPDFTVFIFLAYGSITTGEKLLFFFFFRIYIVQSMCT